MIKVTEKSRFHWLLAGEQAAAERLWDTELFSSKSFIVVPSLGALVPGWLLVVPRRAMLSLRELRPGERRELESLIAEVAAALNKFGGEVFAFEHGSSHQGSRTGCGVDHAHLHLVPLRFDLLSSVLHSMDVDVSWKRSDNLLLTELPRAGEYIALWRVSTGHGAIAQVRNPVSQWMRRFIAARLGVGTDWNYQTKPQLENIKWTVEVLRRTKSSTM